MHDTSTTNTQVDALHAAADFITAHPNLPAPYITSFGHTTELDLNYYLHINDYGDLAEQKSAAAAIVRAVGGDWDKEAWGEQFRFTATRGQLRFDVQVKREAVCERIVVGTETVVLPAQPATPEVTEERDIVEWRCQPLLADRDQDEAVA